MVMRQQENISPENYAVDTEAPLTNFNHCHIGILHQMDRLSELPALLGPAMLAQKLPHKPWIFSIAACWRITKKKSASCFLRCSTAPTLVKSA
jgi:hypothetical protein